MQPAAVNVDGRRYGDQGESSPADEDEHTVETAGRLKALFLRSWPMWLVAFSLNGFFLYLAVLDVLDVGATTPLTGTYYSLLGAGLLATAWHRREIIAVRLRDRRAPVTVCLVAATALAGWFLLNTALLSDGPLARRLAGLLVLWTIPTALVALSVRPRELSALAHGLVALALLLIPIEALAITRAGTDVFRFSPIADLDVISAGLIPSVGAIAALSLRPASARGRILQLAIVTVLVAAAVVPGSRGPVLALVAATLALALIRPPRLAAAAGLAVAVGLVGGSAIGSNIGSLGYLTSTPPSESFEHPDGRARPRPPISTLSVRRHWIEDAVRETQERPIFGHGVGMFEDNTPEARLLGVEGQRTYPHNTFVEAAYSLGVLGLISFIAFVGAAVVALAAVIRSRVGVPEPAVPFALALGVFAFVNTNVSGEIGSDALLWSAVAIALALYVDSARSATRPAGRKG